jgi:hypothetical protein
MPARATKAAQTRRLRQLPSMQRGRLALAAHTAEVRRRKKSRAARKARSLRGGARRSLSRSKSRSLSRSRSRSLSRSKSRSLSRSLRRSLRRSPSRSQSRSRSRTVTKSRSRSRSRSRTVTKSRSRYDRRGKKRSWAGRQWYRAKRHLGRHKKKYLVAALAAATGLAAFKYSGKTVAQLREELMELPDKAYNRADAFFSSPNDVQAAKEEKQANEAAALAALKETKRLEKEQQRLKKKAKDGTLSDEDKEEAERVEKELLSSHKQHQQKTIDAAEAGVTEKKAKEAEVDRRRLEELAKLRSYCDALQRLDKALLDAVHSNDIAGVTFSRAADVLDGVFANDPLHDFLWYKNRVFYRTFNATDLMNMSSQDRSDFITNTGFLLKNYLVQPLTELPHAAAFWQARSSKPKQKERCQAVLLRRPCLYLTYLRTGTFNNCLLPYYTAATLRSYDEQGIGSTAIQTAGIIGKGLSKAALAAVGYTGASVIDTLGRFF